MEKMQFGGVRGQILSDVGLSLFEEFQGVMSVFQGKVTDPLDITNNVSDTLVYRPSQILYRVQSSTLDLKPPILMVRETMTYLSGKAV